MISLILAEKIFSLFIIMLLSMLVVKAKFLTSEDTRVISVLMLYLFFPCVILNAFQVELTPAIQKGMFLATFAAVVIHILLLALGAVAGKVLHLSPIEKCSVIYSNAGNLVVPLVVSVIGPEWVIYTMGFMCVQLFLMWTHAKALIEQAQHIKWAKILLNTNMLACYLGVLILFTGFRFPSPVHDAMASLGSTVGPMGMIIAGMLLGSMTWDKLKIHKRLPLVIILRLIVCPLIAVVFLKYSGIAAWAPKGDIILLITLIATATPSATTLVGFASLYNNEPGYASAINVATATLCAFTMPFIVWFYQM